LLIHFKEQRDKHQPDGLLGSNSVFTYRLIAVLLHFVMSELPQADLSLITFFWNLISNINWGWKDLVQLAIPNFNRNLDFYLSLCNIFNTFTQENIN